jgi:hypothetical protein
MKMEFEHGDVCVMRISGTLTRAEFAANQEIIAQKADSGARPRILAILENFNGWERGVNWDDLDFLLTHSDQIARIAVVAEPAWEVKALAFAGAGVRRAPVKFFHPNQASEARQWLME